MPNRLADEKSLYLRQHANNPVDWWPWCEEAWELARAQDKPVLVSIGYSSCHWCHVMARECFANDFIAGLMNRHFVCIKVDREERPDLDQLFMESVQMITGQGGWPLNAFCLPDGRPFFGGTYFPPEDRNVGIVPWPQLLMRIADHYRKARGELEENAQSIFGNLYHSNEPLGLRQPGSGLAARDLITAAEGLCSQYDAQNGGFGGAPKFPPAMSLGFLDAVRSSAAVEARPSLAAQLDAVMSGTLTAMARGGIYDQIGGGFARYSVDAHWEIPHFEKMLYDNALLIGAYLKGYQRYRDPLYLSIIEETIGWLDAEMKAASAPGYYAALDADSGGKEGIYYLWKPAEVESVLGAEQATAFCHAYGISEQGNFENSGLSNPVWHGKEQSLRDALAPARAKLLAARRQRTAPGRDNKILTGWNALLAASLAEAGFWLKRDAWLEQARTLVDWLWDTMATTAEDGTVALRAVYYEDGGASVDAFLDDYAALAEACLSLAGKISAIDPSAQALYSERANALLATVSRRFADPDAPGWFFTAAATDATTANTENTTGCCGSDSAPHAHAHSGADSGHTNGCCKDTRQATDADAGADTGCCGGRGHDHDCDEADSEQAQSSGCCGGHGHHDHDDHVHEHEHSGCCGGHGHDCDEDDSEQAHSGGCCGGGGNGSGHGGCGCSHGADEPEIIPFSAPSPGGTLLRKKYWLDNATPTGTSQLAHAFAGQQAVGEVETAAQAGSILGKLRPAYAGIASRAPAAVAHALSAFTQQALGIAVVKTPPSQEAANALRNALADNRPWRRVFLIPQSSPTGSGETDAADSKSAATATAAATAPTGGASPDGSGYGYLLCVGNQCLPAINNADEVAERI